MLFSAINAFLRGTSGRILEKDGVWPVSCMKIQLRPRGSAKTRKTAVSVTLRELVRRFFMLFWQEITSEAGFGKWKAYDR